MPKGPPQRVLYCIWQDPWMTVSRGTYIAAMLAEIGWSVPDLSDPDVISVVMKKAKKPKKTSG